ncbi:hypothetical protein SUGI_1172780 [Cryptomeria japonica]|nr:hypothetical protein SUGI_1172780 [Cryptomeria japonica]
MSSGGAPCGACKFLRRKCVSGCIFAPYFDSDQGAAHFAAVHKIFGASNVSKLLQHIPLPKRGEAVVTICYEAQARLKDPVYGCVAHIFALQQQVVNLQAELAFVQSQLANRMASHTHTHANELTTPPFIASSSSSYDHRSNQFDAAQLSISCHAVNSGAGASSSLPYSERLKEESSVSAFPAMPTYNNISASQLVEPGNFMIPEIFQRNRENEDSDDGGELQALAHELLRRNASKPLSRSS